MGFNNEHAQRVHVRGPLVFDIETAPLPDVQAYLDPVKPAANLKDPEKIEADIAERTAKRDAECSLDIHTARIVAIGTWSLNQGVMVDTLKDEQKERQALAAFWMLAHNRKVIGFRCREFDLPMLIQRSRYLRVKPLDLDLGRFSRRSDLVDLYDVLTFQDTQRTSAMRRSLKSFGRRIGLRVTDETDGADVPALVAAGNWQAVAAHCRADIQTTVGLAEWLGYLPAVIDEPKPVEMF